MAHPYGWIPDLPDHRDLLYPTSGAKSARLPARVDLRPACPPVYDQGALGSCTAQAIAAALEFDRIKQRATDVFVPSRLFIYYNERVMEGTVDTDAGAMIRDGIKSVAHEGAPHEAIWPYTITRFRTRPSSGAFREAVRYQALRYRRLAPHIDQLRSCLAGGDPFVFGFTVYEGFESATVARTGRVMMPAPDERALGGHAVLAVGYDDPSQRFIVRNSWGRHWGLEGYFTLPYAYLLSPGLSDDFWTITNVAA